MNEVLFSICAASMLTAIYRYFAPSDKFGAQIKLLLACFFVLTVIGAVTGAYGGAELPDIANADGSYNDYTVQIRSMTARETAENLRKAIRERLAEKGIVPEKIYIDVNISDTGCISISEVRLVFTADDHEAYAEKAVVLVRAMTGTETAVTAEKIH